jgi:hypothetical protein
MLPLLYTQTLAVAEEKPAEEKSEEASNAAAVTKPKPVEENTPATIAPAPSDAELKKTEAGHTLKPVGRKAALKDVEPAIKVIHEQNMKEPKKNPDNQAAQVPKTFSQLDQFITFDGRAFNPDLIGLMPDGTEASNMPAAIAGTVDKPKSVEHCANSAAASMTSYEAGKLAGTRTDPPELAREVTKKEDVTETAVRQPKDGLDP